VLDIVGPGQTLHTKLGQNSSHFVLVCKEIRPKMTLFTTMQDRVASGCFYDSK
jgi:hypothetical protein